MTKRCFSIVCSILVAVGVSSAQADDAAAPVSVTAPAHAAKAKTKVKTKPAALAAPAGANQDAKISDPSTQLTGTPKSTKSTLAPGTKDLLADPNGGPSLDLKWHANNDPVDPYNVVRHTAGPDGQGAGVEAGVKFGF